MDVDYSFSKRRTMKEAFQNVVKFIVEIFHHEETPPEIKVKAAAVILEVLPVDPSLVLKARPKKRRPRVKFHSDKIHSVKVVHRRKVDKPP